MGAVAAIGGAGALEGFSLAGVTVAIVDDDRDAVDAWHGLPDDVVLVVLSRGARRSLGDLLLERPDVLTVVAP